MKVYILGKDLLLVNRLGKSMQKSFRDLFKKPLCGFGRGY